MHINHDGHRYPLPPTWPTDKQTRTREFNGAMIVVHPDRTPLLLKCGKVEELECNNNVSHETILIQSKVYVKEG